MSIDFSKLLLPVKYNRKIAAVGRSMVNVIEIAAELGYLDIPQGILENDFIEVGIKKIILEYANMQFRELA